MTIGTLFGSRLIENVHMVDKTQNRTHYKKRINKKWGSKYGYTNTPKKDVMVAGNNIIGHPETLRLLINQSRTS